MSGGVGTIIDMRELGGGPAYAGVDAIVVANFREAQQVSNDLKAKGKDDEFVVIYPGMIIAGFRFRNVHFSQNVYYRHGCEFTVQQWFNSDVRCRIVPGGEVIMTP